MTSEDKARVLITRDCNRHCSGCCNTYSNIMANIRQIDALSDLIDYKEIILTGGEPMLYPDRTERIIDELKGLAPSSKIYLYSAMYDENLEKIISKIDGFQYTIHKEATTKDIDLFYKVQNLLRSHKDSWREKSLRLYIDNKVDLSINVFSDAWNNVKISKWLTEKELLDMQPKGLPINEILFFYTGD